MAMLVGALALGQAQAHAQSGGGPQPVKYKLRKESTFQRGCFPPCECPMLVATRVRGTFDLTPAGFDGLFNLYDVSDAKWRAVFGGGDLLIAGSGLYRIGGEFALQNQLALDLQVGGDPVQRFDSGLVVGGSQFPRIDLSVSIHGEFCFDTVIDVHAEPVVKLAMFDTDLGWDPVPGAMGYDIVRGDLGALRATGGDFADATLECLGNDLNIAGLPAGPDPPPGQAFWFLARAIYTGGPGEYDSGDLSQARRPDDGIEASSLSCP